jgi:hypothetical protein
MEEEKIINICRQIDDIPRTLEENQEKYKRVYNSCLEESKAG